MWKDTKQILLAFLVIYCLTFTVTGTIQLMFPQTKDKIAAKDLERALKAANICKDPLVQRIMAAK